MEKDTYYFQHDYEPTSDPKIQALIGEHGAFGYGIFWRIVEMLHSNSDHTLPMKTYIFIAIAKQMLASDDDIKKIVMDCIDRYELFESDKLKFWSNRVFANLEKRKKISEVRSLAGHKGAIARREKAIAKQNIAKERKEKKRK